MYTHTASRAYAILQTLVLAIFAFVVLFDPGTPLFGSLTSSVAGAALCGAGLGLMFAAFMAIRGAVQIAPAPKAGARLVTSGVYRFLRHPIYTAILLAAAGLFLRKPTVNVAANFAVVVLFLIFKTRFEEALLIERYPAYAEYRRRTWGLIPGLRGSPLWAVVIAAASIGSACGLTGAGQQASRYDDLTTLFSAWRTFQAPKLVDGVPDYSAAAMAAQQRELPAYQRRLSAIDPGGWPVPQQVDWQIVRAEMNGLDFDHRVLKPWANDPAFYVMLFPDRSDQPAREGPVVHGAIELWTYAFPLAPDAASRLDAGIRVIPRLLEQARTNLTGNGRDLWIFGAKSIRQQSADLAALAARVADAGPLKADVLRAKEATDRFASWLDAQASSKTGPSGIGIDKYDWYLKNVQLVPYTWRDEVVIMERELARAHAFLALEERRNAGLPQLVPVASAEEHARRFNEAVTEYMGFLRSHEIMTIREYLEPALRAQIGRFTPGPREFFTEVDYRDPEIMRTHGYHWFDLARMANEPHPSPISRGPLLYNIFNTRTEGHATGWEELMLQAGMLDARPRARELIYVLVGQRAARALGDLKMHANELTLEQAAAFASANTPRGWLRLDARTVRTEQFLYLQQPAYGTSYLIGKIQVEMLLAARKRQLGDAFTMRRFMDEFNAAGLIPASLLRWELTGEKPADVARMLASPAGEGR